MKSRYELGRLFGISVYTHWSLVLALAGLFVWMLWQGRSLAMAIDGLVLTMALFACVILHEFGHALTARRFGIPTLNITMYPIGGIALLARMPREPRQELLIALAGPAVNLFIAGVLFVFAMAGGGLEGVGLIVRNEAGGTAILSSLMSMNLLLVGFNLVPAFPMDGGRVLRAALASRLSYRAATRIASYTGQAFAVLFAFAAILPNPVLPGFNPVVLFIALFVFAAAREESAQVLRVPETQP